MRVRLFCIILLGVNTIGKGDNKLNNFNIITSEFLQELGFKGKSLRDLESIILNEEGLEDFKSFILLNDGKLKSKIQIVYKYKLHLKEKSIYSKKLFVSDYKKETSREAKRKIIEKMTNEHVSVQELDKIQSYIENKVLTIENIYDILKEYGVEYSLHTILNMIESSKGNPSKIFKRVKNFCAKALILGLSFSATASMYSVLTQVAS